MPKNIHEAIHEVMKKVGYVQKQRASGLNYTYAGEAALIQALRPEMVEQGIYMSVAEIADTERSEYATSTGKTMQSTLITAIVRFTHAQSDTSIEVQAVGEGADIGDKSANKAMTGLFKYALRQTFMIETGDDPDKDPSQPRENKDAGPVTAAAWETWQELGKRAKKVGVSLDDVERKDYTLGTFRKLYKEQEAFIRDAEEQEKVGA